MTRGGRPKGFVVSAETRARMSAARKQALADPEVRARMSAASKRALADPDIRARMSAARKQALADPGKGPKHLRSLTSEQREIYRLYRRKGFGRAEALVAAQPVRLAA